MAQKQRAALAERLAAALGEVKAQRQQAEATRGVLKDSQRGAAEAAARADRAGAAVDAAAAQAARAEGAQAELAQLRGEEGTLHALSLEATEVGHTPRRVAPPTRPRHHPCHPPMPCVHTARTGARAANATELGARAGRQGCADGAAKADD